MFAIRFSSVSSLVVALVAVAIAGGCHSIYRVTMKEIGQSNKERLAQRVLEARDKHSSAREAFADSFTLLSSIEGADASNDQKLSQLHDRLNRQLNLAELETWNFRRQLASLRDVAPVLTEQASNARQLTRQYERTLEQMTRTEAEMQRAIEGMKQQAMLLRANIDPDAVMSFRAAATPRTQRATLMAQLDESLRRLELLLEQLP